MEYLDVVDENDFVIDKASVEQIYQKKLPHRICHVVVFNDRDEILLQMRSKNKSYLPGYWCTSACGHVQSGESFEEGAIREAEEELGEKMEVTFVDKILFKEKDRGMSKFLGVYKATNNGPFGINTDEVEQVVFFSVEHIKHMIKNGEKFHPELLFIIEQGLI